MRPGVQMPLCQAQSMVHMFAVELLLHELSKLTL